MESGKKGEKKKILMKVKQGGVPVGLGFESRFKSLMKKTLLKIASQRGLFCAYFHFKLSYDHL